MRFRQDREGGRRVDLGLQGKGVIVTGGSLGIGRAIAVGLAKEGCNVAVNDRRLHQFRNHSALDDLEVTLSRLDKRGKAE